MNSFLARLNLVSLLAAVLVGLLLPQWALAQTPVKWVSGGGPNPDYEIGGNPAVKHGSDGGGYVRSITQAPKDFGNLMTTMAPGPYVGKRMRLSGYVKTENLDKEVLLWIRVDGPNDAVLAIDNMRNRPIKGTTDWRKYDLVVDVPADSVRIAYGIILVGVGKAWADGLTLETVGPEVPVTSLSLWDPTGSNPEDYDMGGNPNLPHGSDGGGYIRSKVAEPRTFGTWASATMVDPFLGKRIRLSGYVRTENVENLVGIWMRVDGPKGRLAFDNMGNRPIKGTTDWRKYDVVLDVPATAVAVSYGIILQGRGQAWFDGVTLEVVGTDVPVTQIPNPYQEFYAGNFAVAAKLFPDRIARTPASYSLRLFHFLALHRSGQVNEALAYLAGVADGLADTKWTAPVVLFYAGKLSEDEVLKAAADPNPTIDKQQKCEAYYYLGMAYLTNLGTVTGDGPSRAAKARQYLEQSVATGVTNYVEYLAAKAELERMKK